MLKEIISLIAILEIFYKGLLLIKIISIESHFNCMKANDKC